MLEEFIDVRIKSTGITGTIVDISAIKGETKIIVECDEQNVPNGYGPENRLIDCTADELEKVE